MFRPMPEQRFALGEQRYARQHRVVPAGKRNITFDFALSSGWEGRDFCRNVRVRAPRSQEHVGIQILINESNVFFAKAVEETRVALQGNSDAVNLLKVTSRKLKEPYPSPETADIVINSMARLALAHSMQLISLDDSHVMDYLYPMAVNYDAQITQTEGLLHDRVAQAFERHRITGVA
jgi:hypothetical protein